MIAQSTLPFASGSETSQAAAESMATHAPALRRRVFECIKSLGPNGATCDAIELCLQLSHQSCSARVYELHKTKMIVDSGRRRATRSGRTAVVYVAAET